MVGLLQLLDVEVNLVPHFHCLPTFILCLRTFLVLIFHLVEIHPLLGVHLAHDRKQFVALLLRKVGFGCNKLLQLCHKLLLGQSVATMLSLCLNNYRRG